MVSIGAPSEQIDPGKVGDKARSGSSGHITWRACLHHRAALYHDELVRQRHRLERIVGHEQAHAMKGRELPAQLAAHFRADGNVESRQRLVEQQELRLGRERAQKSDALRLPAGQRSGQSVRSISEAGFVEPPTSNGGRVRPALSAQAKGDVLDRAQVRKEDMVLEHEAGSPALWGYVNPTRAVVEDLAVESHSAFHLIQARQRSQQGGLSRSVGT